jgi:hypothetical protein
MVIPRADAPQQPTNDHFFSQLRQFEHLAVVEVDFIEHRGFTHSRHKGVLEDLRDAWNRGFIEVLKNSRSRDRKFVRWRGIEKWNCATRPRLEHYEISKSGEIEVFS